MILSTYHVSTRPDPTASFETNDDTMTKLRATPIRPPMTKSGTKLRTNLRAPGLRIAIAGLAALAIAMGVGRFAFTPLLPMMRVDAGLSVADGGWLASANYLGYLLGAMSAMAVRIRAATAIRGGLVVIGVTTIAMGLEHRYAAWMVLRTVAGIANAWVAIFVFAWCMERLAPLNRPLLGGLVFAGVGAGIMVVGTLCMALMHAAVGSAG